eukprot:5017904-Lingulodinium_polyedra.AAC.1
MAASAALPWGPGASAASSVVSSLRASTGRQRRHHAVPRRVSVGGRQTTRPASVRQIRHAWPLSLAARFLRRAEPTAPPASSRN